MHKEQIEEIKTHLRNISADTTCPIHIAAEIDQLIELIDSMDTVVYCKDCEYQGTSKCPTYYEDRMTYRDCWELDGDYDFCSEGLRKDTADG